MRVAIVAPSLDSIGGQSAQARILRDNLQCDGHRVLFVPIDPAFPRWLAWVRRVPYARTVLNQLLYVPSLLRVRSTDVVHVFAASYWSFLLAVMPAVVVARLFRRRSVLAYHSGEAADHLERWGRLVHPCLRLADTITVPSDYLQRVFLNHGYHARVIHNVVDTSRFRYRERNRLRPRLLSTRNLEPHYRVGDVLRAFALLRARLPQATLTIAGAGSEERRLRELACELGSAGIRFLGSVEPARVPQLYDEADFFVNASVVDNQPVSVLEAFASGVVVISTPTGDIPAMVAHGKAGRLVGSRDPREMADAISELIERPERALALVRGARAELAKYDWSRVQQDWTAVFQAAAA